MVDVDGLPKTVVIQWSMQVTMRMADKCEYINKT